MIRTLYILMLVSVMSGALTGCANLGRADGGDEDGASRPSQQSDGHQRRRH
jgi:hypothetical protein